MNGNYRVFIGITTILMVLGGGVYALGTTQNSTDAQEQVNAPATTHTDPPVLTPVAARAWSDMRNFARRELGDFHPQPGSFDSTEFYSHDHLLHWMTIEHEGRLIYLYHLTEKEHPERRYTAMWSTHESLATPWELVP